MLLLGQAILAESEKVAQNSLTFDAATVASAISFFVPLVVSLITKREASATVKALANILGVAVAAVVSLYLSKDGVPVTLQTAVFTFVSALVASLAAYQGVWKPLGAKRAVENIAPDSGIGSDSTANQYER